MRPLHFVPKHMFVAVCGKGAARIRFVSTREGWNKQGGRHCPACAKVVAMVRGKEVKT